MLFQAHFGKAFRKNDYAFHQIGGNRKQYSFFGGQHGTKVLLKGAEA